MIHEDRKTNRPQSQGVRHSPTRRIGIVLFTALTAAATFATIVPQAALADTPPARLVGLASGNSLVQFNEDSPGTILSTTSVTGLQVGESVRSIEVRPGTGQLLALAVTDTVGADQGRLYSVDPATGAATPTGAGTVNVIADGARTTIDINPTVDRLRVVGSLDQSLRLNPNVGTLAATDTSLNPAGQQIVNVAYDQNVAAAAPGATTTLFGISALGSLVRIGGVNAVPSPNGGVVTTIGPLGIAADDANVGFDITSQGTAFASMKVAGVTSLYTLNLSTGAATAVGPIGTGLVPVSDITALSSVPTTAAQYIALPASARVLDTRSSTRLNAGDVRTVAIRSQVGVPANATAVVVNATITASAGVGFVSVYPSGITRTDTSVLNTDASGQTRAALVTLPVGSNGAIDLYTSIASHLIVDVVGYYSPPTTGAGRFLPLTPVRALDTRNGIGTGGSTTKPVSDSFVDVQVLGVGGVPATNVSAVVVTLTATATSAPGFFTAFASGTTRPNASNLNATETNEDIANLAIVPVGANGKVSVYTETGSHLLVDVVGYFGSDGNALATRRGLLVPVVPSRILDSRSGNGVAIGRVNAAATVDVQVTGRGGVPATGILGVVGTVTVDATTSPGFVTSYPTQATRPETSTLNVVRAGQTIAGPITLGLGVGGKISVFTSTNTHLIADVTGYYLA